MWGSVENNGCIQIKFTYWQLRKLCPFINSCTVEDDFILKDNNSIVDFIIASVSSGHYLFLSYDEFYISHHINYMKRHINHLLFVFGFDNKEKLFYIADFFYKNKFSFEKAFFNEVENAIYNVRNIPLTIAPFYIVNEKLKYQDNNYEFDILNVSRRIKDYLNSSYSFSIEEKEILTEIERQEIKKNNIVYGLENYDLIIIYLEKIMSNNIFIKDIIPFHVLYDHKVIIRSMIGYIKEHNYIKISNELYNSFKEIEEMCLINRNLFIKYILSSNVELIRRIIEYLNAIAFKEKEAMLRLIDLF